LPAEISTGASVKFRNRIGRYNIAFLMDDSELANPRQSQKYALPSFARLLFPEMLKWRSII